MINFSNLLNGAPIKFDLESDDLRALQYNLGGLSYLTQIEAVPDQKNPEFMYIVEKGGEYVLYVDKEKAEGGTFTFGVDILYEDGTLAKRLDLKVDLVKTKEEGDGTSDDGDDEDDDKVDKDDEDAEGSGDDEGDGDDAGDDADDDNDGSD